MAGAEIVRCDDFVRLEPRQGRSVAGRRRPVAYFHPKPVAGRMAADVVDPLEPIDVNAQHRKRGIAPTAECLR